MRDMSQRVTETTFEQEVLRAAGSVLVDFWAEWCTPYHAVRPFSGASPRSATSSS
jgi:thioredoxin 1